MDAFHNQQRFDWLLPEWPGQPARNYELSSMSQALQTQTTRKNRDDFRGDSQTSGFLCCENRPTIQGRIERKGDRDWFRIDLTAGKQYQFELKGFGLKETELQLRNRKGEIESTSIKTRNSNDSTIEFTAPNSGTYFLDAGGSSRRKIGRYELNAIVQKHTTEDQFDQFDPITGEPSYSTYNGFGELDARAALSKLRGRPAEIHNNPETTEWWLDRLGAQAIWAEGITGRGITVAVIDTGIDWHHSDLDANIWTNNNEIAYNGIDDDGNGYIDDVRGWDFVEEDNDPNDAHGHGTHVAGLIAAEHNDFGISGAAPDAKLMPIRVLDDQGMGILDNVVRGIHYAIDNGASVINLSLGASFGTTELFQAVRRACESNVMVVMAAGNDSANQPLYPAAYAMSFGLAVGANTSSGALAWFSNRSGLSRMDYLTAGGTNLLSTLPGESYGYASGTSMAAPVVAGAAALLRQAAPWLNRQELEQLLCSTARGAIV